MYPTPYADCMRRQVSKPGAGRTQQHILSAGDFNVGQLTRYSDRKKKKKRESEGERSAASVTVLYQELDNRSAGLLLPAYADTCSIVF